MLRPVLRCSRACCPTLHAFLRRQFRPEVKRLYTVGQAQDWRVAHGPFAGMQLPADEMISNLLPMLSGTFEQPLHPVIEELVARQPAKIVNLGAAEGYYAVGLAQRLPGADIIAFETLPAGREQLQETARINGIPPRLEIRESATLENLDTLDWAQAVLICDIEGAEEDLLIPERVTGLRSIPLLVELHEPMRPGSKKKLQERFRDSHAIRSIQPEPPDAQGVPAMDENRAFEPEWLWMTPR